LPRYLANCQFGFRAHRRGLRFRLVNQAIPRTSGSISSKMGLEFRLLTQPCQQQCARRFVFMNLIQSAVQVSSGVAKPDAPAPTGQGQNAFAEALQSQQNSPDAPVITTPQPKPARGLSQAALNTKNATQNWTGDAVSGWQIVPMPTELVKLAGPPVAQNAGVTAVATETAPNAPTPGNAPASCLMACATPSLATISSAYNAALIEVPREPYTTNVTAQSQPGPSVVTAFRDSPVVNLPRTISPQNAVSPAVIPTSPSPALAVPPEPGPSAAAAAPQSSPALDIHRTISPAGALSPAGISVSPMPEPTIPTDRGAAATAEGDQPSDPTQPVSAPPISSQPLSDSEIGVPDLQSSTTTPQIATGQLDAAALDISRAVPQPYGAAPPPDGMLAPQTANAVAIDSSGQSSAVRPYFAIPIKPVGIDFPERSLDPTKNLSPSPQFATSSQQRGPISTTAALHTPPIQLNPGQAPGIVQTQAKQPATYGQTRQGKSDCAKSPASEIVAAIPLSDVPRPTFASTPTETHVATTPKAAFTADKGSGDSRSPFGQGVSAKDTADVSTKSTQVTNPQAPAPLAPENVQAQSGTPEESNSVTAVNLMTPPSKPQPGLGSLAGANQPSLPARSDQAGQAEPVNTGILTARMVEGAGQADMHIGLRTQAFGTVNLHTALRDAQVGLAVSSERGDLRSFFSSEMPALQSALRQHDLHFENIKFVQSSAAAFSADTNSESRPFTQRQPSMPRFSQDAAEEDSQSEDISPEIPARLSVLA